MSLQLNNGRVRRFSMAMKFGTWLQNIPNKLTPPPFRLIQIGSAFWQSRVLYVAAKLDIASILGDKELSKSELATKIMCDVDATNRLMRMLVAMGVFNEISPSVYKNNKLSEYLRTNNPSNVRAMILMHNSDVMSRPWFVQLEQGIRVGTPPFQLVHNKELFDYLDDHGDFDQLFSEAMDSVEALTGDSFVTDFDWSQFDRIIDIGGSRGAKSLSIIKKHPNMTALVVDRHHVISEAKQYWSTNHIAGAERLQFLESDLLKSIPFAKSNKDIYLLSAVLHGLDHENCVLALRNLAQAIGNKGARVALMEMILPEVGADIASASFDMQMFMGTSGRERTLKEWQSLINDAGLILDEVVRLQSFGSILVLKSGIS